MKQDKVAIRSPEGGRNNAIEGNRLSLDRCAVKAVPEAFLSNSVPGDGQKKMQGPEALTVVKSPTPQTDFITEEILCDDILSCISALDEVIAEFDDSISHSSSSSLASGSSASIQKCQLNQFCETKPGESTQTPLANSSVHDSAPPDIVPVMEDPRLEDFEQRLGQCQRSSPPKARMLEHSPIPTVAPIKPARQSKKINAPRQPPSEASPLPFQIEPHLPGNSNGNHTSYGIVFPKTTNQSPSHVYLNNNNGISPSSPKILEIGTGSSFPRTKPNKSVDAVRATAKSSSSSPQKQIPVTFVMKPEDLERFLENDTEEDWNCHIEKNLPRSLRKTRKTCFVEDDEEEQEKYCRSPKDFRKNLIHGNDSPRRSPLLQQRKSSIPKELPSETRAAIPAQWMRYEDANAICLQESPKSNVNNNNYHESAISRNLNEMFCRKGQQNPQRSPPATSTTPVTLDQVLDIDDGYLSMINRHEAPLLWPEGAIETETFTADELKRLSVSNLNYLNGRVKGQEKGTDYFSDDSLEFDAEAECSNPRTVAQNAHLQQSDKISSFICASAGLSSSPALVQPYINKSSTRKSWSPASEIRIPGKSTINTNTWRKGVPSVISALDENTEERFIFPKKASSPVRKPCAFFIPIHKPEVENPSAQDTAKYSKEVVIVTVESAAKSTEAVAVPELSIESLAIRISQNALQGGIQEAACIKSLLASPPSEGEELNGNVCDEQFVTVDLVSLSAGRAESSPNSSLALSNEERLGSSESERRELESSSSSSGIDYETSSEGRERTLESLQGASFREEPTFTATPPKVQIPMSWVSRPPADDIEDLYESPPSFIPPPPQTVASSSPVLHQSKPTLRPASIVVTPNRNSSVRNSGASESDYFPENLPTRGVAGERPLRTQRQTSRSHENLLDIDRHEMPHPCVRRGHSATLPSNAVPPTARRPSALRQFFGIFRRNKKNSNVSAPGALDYSNQNQLNGSIHIEDDSPQLPEHFGPYRPTRPSISDSHGSQRSNSSKLSTKRSVLSRIFRRKEK